MAPSAVEQALRENIQLKVEFQTLRTELKRYKKLLIEGDKAIQNLTRERDEALQGAKGKGRASLGGNASARERELENRLQEQEEQRDLWERKARELHKENKQMRGGAATEEVEVRLRRSLPLFLGSPLLRTGPSQSTLGRQLRVRPSATTADRRTRRARRAAAGGGRYAG
jgi:hypothetical protein